MGFLYEAPTPSFYVSNIILMHIDEKKVIFLLWRRKRTDIEVKNLPDLNESLVKEAKVFVSLYSLMLLFNDFLPIFSCGMQHWKHPAILLSFFPTLISIWPHQIRKIITILHLFVTPWRLSVDTTKSVWNGETNLLSYQFVLIPEKPEPGFSGN